MTAEMAFDVVLQAGGPSGRNLMIELPSDPKPVFGTARAKVTAQLDDHPPFATTLAVMGGKNLFGLSQDRIAALGVTAGQTVHVRLVHDASSREVEVPAELAAGFASDTEARAAFDALTASQRKEFCRWVGEAKQQTTRDTRATTAVIRLREGHRTPR
ncbi:YdeI/OmpD-associated family protein [Jatrophihabitans sp. YIM 134969]